MPPKVDDYLSSLAPSIPGACYDQTPACPCLTGAVLTVSVSLAAVCVHSDRYPAPVLLHVHLRLDVPGGAAHVPHDDGGA